MGDFFKSITISSALPNQQFLQQTISQHSNYAAAYRLRFSDFIFPDGEDFNQDLVHILMPLNVFHFVNFFNAADFSR